MSNELVIWSKFGLWRTTTAEELRSGELVDATEGDVEAFLSSPNAALLTHIDVEPVVVLHGYPDEETPIQLAWLGIGDET